MRRRAKRTRYAQNRIAYIVYSNPRHVRKLVRTHRQTAPGNVHDLVRVTKRLVRKKGRPFIQALVQLHPDRKAILEAEKSHEDTYCGACNNYTYDPGAQRCRQCGHSPRSLPQPLQQLAEMGLQALEERYEKAAARANNDPQNTALSEEVRLIWNELRLRKKEGQPPPEATPTESPLSPPLPEGIQVHPREALLILGLTLVAGGLIGSAWKFNQVPS